MQTVMGGFSTCGLFLEYSIKKESVSGIGRILIQYLRKLIPSLRTVTHPGVGRMIKKEGTYKNRKKNILYF